MRGKKEEVDLFGTDEDDGLTVPTVSAANYSDLMAWLEKKNNPAILPIQIAYYTGLRIGEVCGLTWQDINLDEQVLTVHRSIRYNGRRHQYEIGTTKRAKIREVDFCDTLAKILREAKKEQHRNRFEYMELYHLNYYREVKEKDRTYYDLFTFSRGDSIPEEYHEISFVCLRADGAIELPSTVSEVCRTAAQKVPGLEGFHFHRLRHTYATNFTVFRPP